MGGARTVSACPGPSGCATRSRSPTRCPATRSGRSGSSRSRRRWSATTGSAATSCDAPEATRDAAARRAPGRAHRLHRGAVRRAAAGRSTSTRSRCAATYEAAVRAAGGAVALVDALLERGGRDGLLGHAPAGAPRRAGAGDGLLLLRQRGGGGAACACRARRRAGADPRLGRPPRQRDERDLRGGPERAVRLDPRVAAVSGHRAGVRSGVGRRRGLHGEPAGARAGRATRRTARWSTTSCCR